MPALAFHQIKDTATPDFHWAWQLYEQAFPPEERRSLAQQKTLLSAQQAYSFYLIFNGSESIGLMGVWNLTSFSFLEHFATAPEVRGQGWGTKAINALVEMLPTPILLEVELPLMPLAVRRIRFYERCGFYSNDFKYHQPPYSPNKPWAPLQIMSYPEKQDSESLAIFKLKLYETVYEVRP